MALRNDIDLDALLGLPLDQAAAVVTRWLERRGMSRTLASFADEVCSWARMLLGARICAFWVAAALQLGEGGAESTPPVRLPHPPHALIAPAPSSASACISLTHLRPLQAASAAALEPPEAKYGGSSSDALSKAVDASTPAVAPAAEALPVPGTSSRPGKLYAKHWVLFCQHNQDALLLLFWLFTLEL